MEFPDFEAALQKEVRAGRLPGGAVAAAWKTHKGVEHYSYAYGKENVAPDSRDMTVDSLLWLASCTKLLTAVAVMQVVERGLVTLDQDLSTILPEFKPPIPIASLDDAGKVLAMSSTDTPFTLRRLLTHTSGLTYEGGSPELQAWRASLPASSPFHTSSVKHDGNIEHDYLHPLIFEPSSPGRWQYGPSIDWAGKVVERVNTEKLTLGPYLAKHVFEPLGLKDMTFRPLRDPGKAERLFFRSQVEADGSLTLDPMKLNPHKDPVDEGGGGGCYGTAKDYIRVLESLMLDDHRLLRSSSVVELFKPQLPDSARLQARLAPNNDALWVVMESPDENPDKVQWNWSLCGQVALDAVPGKCEAGLNVWSGLANTYWFIDHKHGSCGFWGSQIFPCGYVVSERLHGKLQKDVFKAAEPF